MALYFDSFLFVSVSAIVKGIGSNTSKGICEASILICKYVYSRAVSLKVTKSLRRYLFLL